MSLSWRRQQQELLWGDPFAFSLISLTVFLLLFWYFSFCLGLSKLRNEFLTLPTYPPHLCPSAHPLPTPYRRPPLLGFSLLITHRIWHPFFRVFSLLSLVWFVGFLLMFVHLAEDLKRRSLVQFVSEKVGGLGWAEKR